ncbi:hypothetical protein [Xanthomonas axonopodis]
MYFRTNVETFLGFKLPSNWWPIIDSLELWGCKPFEAAAIIGMMIRRKKKGQQASSNYMELDRLEKLALSGAPELDLFNNRKLQKMQSDLPDETAFNSWLKLLKIAKKLKADDSTIAELFYRFISGALAVENEDQLATLIYNIQNAAPGHSPP